MAAGELKGGEEVEGDIREDYGDGGGGGDKGTNGIKRIKGIIIIYQ